MPITLNQVQSFIDLIDNTADTTGIAQQIANSPDQLVILGGGPASSPLNMSIADPTGNKIILGYLDLTQTSPVNNPDLFTSSTLPSWFGNEVTGWESIRLYSVEYWNPAWQTEVFNRINQLISQGYNGVFLDSGSGDEWLPGNPEGNQVNENATQDLISLISSIRTYVNGLHLSSPFYLIANNPALIAENDPSALASLDGIFNEGIYYYSSDPSGTIVSLPNNQGSVENILNIALPAYKQSGLPVFGSDYPNTSNLVQDFQTFAAYSALGFIPSVVNATTTEETLVDGPYMFMATAAASTVTGDPNFVNFISGGLAPSTTLIGGNRGDFFIGGPGQNTIKGGAGNDTIYAHPANAGQKGVIQLEVVNGDVNAAAAPSVEVKINGQIVVVPTPITQDINSSGYQNQIISIDVSKISTINSVEIDGLGISFTNTNNLSNIFIEGVAYDGKSVPLIDATLNSTGSYQTNPGSPPQILFNAGATATFSGSAFAGASPYPANTSDSIDGGGGLNSVVYRGDAANFAITAETSGSWLVSTAVTAEGPDALTNIQVLDFADTTLYLPDAALTQASLSVLRVQPMSPTMESYFSNLASQVQSGASTDTAAIQSVVAQAENTASVATIAYQFFTGSTPSAAGMDYLVSPTGPNPNNLNSAYYQDFNIENRYINFAVNLGKAGAGAANFQSQYGSLNLTDATTHAYTTLFGEVPTAAKVATLLNTLVPDGLGGQETRAQYFAFYGQDGANGIGTKAAMVGWLMAEAVLANVGDYALTNDAYLTGIANGTGSFAVNMIGQFDQASFHYTGS